MTRALLPIAVAAIALTGCSSEDPADTTAAPAATSNAAPAAGASSASSGAGAAKPSSAAPAGSAVAGAGCPVDAATLQKAFQANAEVAGAIILGKGFKDISCYQGYATALTQPEAMDIAVVVFKYDGTKKAWAALIGGTDNVCENTVPAAIRPKLKHCS